MQQYPPSLMQLARLCDHLMMVFCDVTAHQLHDIFLCAPQSHLDAGERKLDTP